MKHWRVTPDPDGIHPSWHVRSPEIEAQRMIWEAEDAAALEETRRQYEGPSRRRTPAPGELPCPQCLGKGTVQDPADYIRGEAGLICRCDYCLGSGIR